MKKLTLQKVFIHEDRTAFAVTDLDGAILGFLSSKKSKKLGGKKWAFAYVISQFNQHLNYKYDSRLDALDALVACRSVVADTGSLTVVKTPVYL